MNYETTLTLDDAVEEVLGLLTGLELSYDPTLDRYRAIVRQLNRALRANALETEWSYYSDVAKVGEARLGERELRIRSSLRPRVINDDSVRLVNEAGRAVAWAYFLPRDALHKYGKRSGLWCSITRNILEFSRPFNRFEAGLGIEIPVMREPMMFRLPEPHTEGGDPPRVPEHIRDQPVDFPYPDIITLRAAFYYAQSDPVMQPRVQMLEAQYKDIMYQIIERDTRATDSPYLNEFAVPVQNGIHDRGCRPEAHGHPHSDERWV